MQGTFALYLINKINRVQILNLFLSKIKQLGELKYSANFSGWADTEKFPTLLKKIMYCSELRCLSVLASLKNNNVSAKIISSMDQINETVDTFFKCNLRFRHGWYNNKSLFSTGKRQNTWGRYIKTVTLRIDSWPTHW